MLEADKSLTQKILEFVDREGLNAERDRAMDMWLESIGEEPSEDTDVLKFLDWFIHDYKLKDYRKSLIEVFAERRREKLDDEEREVLDGWLRTSLGLYEVTWVEAGKGIGLRDVFTGEERFAEDVRASEDLVKWDLLLVRVLSISGQPSLGGIALRFPRDAKEELVRFGKDLLAEYGTTDPRASWSQVMKEKGYLFYTLQARMKRRLEDTTLVTPEGDAVLISEAVYAVRDFKRALAALDEVEEFDRLDQAVDTEEMLYGWIGQAEEMEPTRKAGAGAIMLSTKLVMESDDEELDDEELAFLGYIHVNPENLTLECLSKERLERGMRLLKASLGDSIQHLSNTYKGIQEALVQAKERETSELIEDEGFRPPASKPFLRDFLEEHYERWVDMRLPALDGKTPKEALKTRDGRAKVEELLKSVENLEERRKKATGLGYPVERIRKKLENSTR